MIQLSFPTKKLKKYIKRVNVKLKDTNYNQHDLTVYGVTNTEGITITGNQTSEDLGNYIVLKENQLAYNPYRVNVGSIGLAPKGLLGLVSPAYIVFETTEELSAEFLYYYLKSSLGVNLIKWYGDRGGVRSALRYNDLCEIDIPDLNLNQQMSVLKKMKEVNAEIEEFNNEVHCQEQLISKLRQSILQEAVQGKLVPQDPNDEPASVLLERIKEEKERLIKEGKIKKEKPLPPISEDEIPYELPEGWEWVRLGEVTNYAYNETLKPDEIDEEEWVLELEDIEKDTSRLIQVIRNKDRKSKSNKNRFYKGDVLYGKLRPYLKKVLVAPEDGVCSTEIIPFRGYGNIESRYIMYIMKSPYIDKIVNSITHGMNMPRLGTKNALELLIPLPPINEQKRIVEKVDQLMALCDELEKNIEQSKKDCELLIQSVLQEAFKEA
jgi:type I restriction enzyme S subunit